MLYSRKRFQIFLFLFLLFCAFIFLTQTKVANAACTVTCEESMCGGKNYKGRKGFDENGQKRCTICSTSCTPDPTAPPHCYPIAMSCSGACGQPSRCSSDGCGGMSCCPATTACPPVVACVDSDGGSFPNVFGKVTISAPALPQVLEDSCLVLVTNGGSSGWVKQATGTHVGEKTCANVATGAYTDTVIACPNGCVNGACNTTVNPCPKRPQGDANCDQSINEGDFAVIKLKMQGGTYTATNHSADFNSDGKVNLVDYEIWRNTVYH